MPSQNSSILERKSISNSAEDAERNEIRGKPPVDLKDNTSSEKPKKAMFQEFEDS